MGSWGHGGWEDDVALDWIDKVITKSKIGAAIEKTLSIGPKDPGYNVLKTRAATTLLIMLVLDSSNRRIAYTCDPQT